MRKVLVVAAHPDDELLGVGGTIRRLVNEGSEVHALILGEGMTSRFSDEERIVDSALGDLYSDTMDASSILGYKAVYFSRLPDNRFDAVPLLEIVKIIERHIDDLKPEVVFTHYDGDINIDHTITYRAVITATRPIEGCPVKEVYMFETPSSTEWGYELAGGAFMPNTFYDISDTISSKLSAMECYRSELRMFPHPRSTEALTVIARRWGSQIGTAYAEAFRAVRICR